MVLGFVKESLSTGTDEGHLDVMEWEKEGKFGEAC